MRGWIWISLAALGVVSFFVSLTPYPIVSFGIVVVAGLGLLGLAMVQVRAHENMRSLLTIIAGSTAVVVGITMRVFEYGLSTNLSLALLGVGIQVVTLGLRMPRDDFFSGLERTIIPIVGHSFALAGLALLAFGGLEARTPALLAAIVGFTIIFTEVLWMRRQSLHAERTGQSWEALLLVALSVNMVIAAVVALIYNMADSFAMAGQILESQAQLTVLAGLAVLAGPPALPERFTLKPGGVAEFWVDAFTFLALLNVVIIFLFIGATVILWPLFIALSLIVLGAVAFEYGSSIFALMRHFARRDESPELVGPMPKITLVMAAKEEPEMLSQNLRTNLDALPGINVLVVLGGNDQASRLAVQQIQNDYPDRVRRIAAPGTAKATDMTVAWNLIQTPYAFVLDVDETVSERSMRTAMKTMEANPGAGIVQGRKVAMDPAHNMLTRFIATERRYATLLDHTTYASGLGAGHFAGSGALIRTDVPRSVGGWKVTSLTEDIEFSLRLANRGQWSIEYDERVTVQEVSPRQFDSFVRQRGRWARGWGEVFGLHIAKLVRNTGKAGFVRTYGYGRQLATAVSAPLVAMLPLLGLLWILAGSPYLATWATWTLAAIILPSRLISYLVAYFLDAERPRKRQVVQVLETAVFAYAWIVFAWFLQLHALYLEMSGVPRTWMRTRPAPLKEFQLVQPQAMAELSILGR